MSLRINSVVGKLPKIVFYAILAILAFAFIKVIIWEQAYYSDKEGSIRVSDQYEDAEDLEEGDIDETEPSLIEVQDYIVAANKPRYLSIPKLGIQNARIREVGLTAKGSIGTLPNIYDIAWYVDSATPGLGGTAIMNGHNGGPTKDGVFKRLDSLKIGDQIIIERGDGAIFTYEVYENKLLSLKEASGYMPKMQKSPIEGVEALSLITCSGDWSQMARTYTSRSMVRATLVQQPQL